MDKKWSIMDKKDVSDKCCQMENAIWNIFQSPSSWINGMNGFIRLVSMDGTWYHHRATDVFIPMTQNYINRFYRLDTRPERGAIRVRSGTVYWDYLNQEEALQILPNLPTSNLPNAQEAAGLGERCRNKKIFLKDGTVYDMDKKIIRPLQWNEEGSILQICHFEDKHKRNNAVLWHYDIYLWAKAGVIPSVLYASRECWNTMQFLVDNFNKIDFDDFLSLSGMDESAVAEPEKELQEEKAESKNEQAAEPVQPAPMKTVEESKHEQAAEPVQPAPMKTVEELKESDAAQIQEQTIQNAVDLQKEIRESENEPTPEIPTEENVAKLQEEAANMEHAQEIERQEEIIKPENAQAAESVQPAPMKTVEESKNEQVTEPIQLTPILTVEESENEQAAEPVQPAPMKTVEESKNEQVTEPIQLTPILTVEESKNEQAAEPVKPTPIKTVEESENEQAAEPVQPAPMKTVEESIKSDAAQIQEQTIQNAVDLQKEIRESENEPTPEIPTEENVAKLQEEAANMEHAQEIERQEEIIKPENAQAAESVQPAPMKTVEESKNEQVTEPIQLPPIVTVEESKNEQVTEPIQLPPIVTVEESKDEQVTEPIQLPPIVTVEESENEQAAEPVQPTPMKTVEESKNEQAAEPVQPTPMKTVEESENEQSAEPIQSASINTVEESIKSDAAQIQEQAIQNAADLQKAIREFENEPTPEMPTEETVAKLQEEAANMERAQAIEREKEAATPENEQAAEDIVEEKTVEVQEEAANVKQAKESEMIIEEKTVESAVLQQSQTTELMAEIKESIASAVAESQPIERTKPQPISAATQNITVTQNASVIPDFPAKLKQTTNQLEKTENMDMMQREEVTVTTDKIQELLDCDKNRCRLEPYDKDILYDIIRGHWELYDSGATEEARKNIKSESEEGAKEFIARNPKLDVKQGVVGIDFGTKSTVVVRQDATNRIVPIRIGTGNLSSEVKEEDFENPSIIEFTNVKKFLEDYQQEVGRPHTSCNDIFVSYDAYEDFRNCKPDDFYAYFNELKQWANHEKGNVIIKDKQKKEYYLGENMGETDDIVNPVELYAYYIGLHINNMRNGIYLKYLMTFPVGYAKEVRDFIAESFYKGIKKSLPTSIINDEECMAQFKVELGISEPAAYAVTALEQNHLEPKDETEQLMYGIFDFGGGTTDFDFGICRGATDEEYDKDAYDYVLECFGADSDVTLGGENILELMAYQVYQKNIDVFREKKITFTLPLGESSFAGSETLLIDSQIAKRNMAILKEELRPLWHQEQGWRKKYELENEVPNEADKEGVVVSLYNMDGEPVPQCMLEFSTQEMVEMIKNRIQKGIDSFFQCLIKIFLYKREDTVEEEPTIYIFLSGNSSKSIFVKELFKKKIEEYYSKARKAGDEMGNAHFELYEPLVGTQDGSGYYVPNAKTGVAYGLLKSREGSSIKIVKNYETDAQQQSRFRYYLGRDRRHYFDCKFSPAEISYKKWVSFQGASREVVRIYYTDNPVADSKLEQLSIENVPYKEITINPMENAYLFIRTVEPNLIEYAVAKEEDDITDSEIKNCYFI